MKHKHTQRMSIKSHRVAAAGLQVRARELHRGRAGRRVTGPAVRGVQNQTNFSRLFTEAVHSLRPLNSSKPEAQYQAHPITAAGLQVRARELHRGRAGRRVTGPVVRGVQNQTNFSRLFTEAVHSLRPLNSSKPAAQYQAHPITAAGLQVRARELHHGRAGRRVTGPVVRGVQNQTNFSRLFGTGPTVKWLSKPTRTITSSPDYSCWTPGRGT
jgi:uncharacterized protein YhbP (UPF0306 family)